MHQDVEFISLKDLPVLPIVPNNNFRRKQRTEIGAREKLIMHRKFSRYRDATVS